MSNRELQNLEGPSAKGVHIISVCKIESAKAISLQDQIEHNAAKRRFLIKTGLATHEQLWNLWEEYNWFLGRLHSLFLVNQIAIENITTTVGRAVFAQILGGDNTFTGNVSHGALGTNATAAVVGNTTLGTETFRKALSSGTDSANTTFLENFYSATDVNGTFEEYGFFIDGSGAADSGQLFNRFTSTIAKSVTESLNVQSQIAWNDA